MRDEKGSHRSWIERELRCLSLGAQLNVESIDNPFDRSDSQQYVSTRQGTLGKVATIILGTRALLSSCRKAKNR